ncbi:hypothetical protein [Sphingobacterium sp.]|uniref:hypothetical protein n=1 Tax=Sphingobacterium sp. TaxID=341027 RepID=UPI0028AC1260|nr:hypothetical protein [Sphingobacterium sp.]
MDKQEIINRLPTEWSQISLNQYIKLISDVPLLAEGTVMDKEYQKEYLNIWFFHFAGMYLDECDFNTMEHIQIVERLNSFSESADKPKIDFSVGDKIIPMDKIKYDKFLTLIEIKDEIIRTQSLDKYPQLINTMLVEPMDNIGDEMDMATANSFFLQLQKQLKEFLAFSQTSLVEKIMMKQKK